MALLPDAPLSGFFISLEGIEGCGKTTQARLLADYLADLNVDAILTYEPGGTDLGDRVREMLLDRKRHFMPPRVELLLYAAARAQHVEEIIRPALMAGTVVICDRFTDSTVAYQGYGLGVDLAAIQMVNALATKNLFPQLTFLCDLTPEEGFRRKFGADALRERTRSGDRVEIRDMEFHHRVREGYLTLARQQPGRIVVLDATQAAEEVHAQVRDALLARPAVREILRCLHSDPAGGGEGEP